MLRLFGYNLKQKNDYFKLYFWVLNGTAIIHHNSLIPETIFRMVTHFGMY